MFETRVPKPGIRITKELKSGIRNQEFETRDSKPEIRNQGLEAKELKPGIRNQGAETWNSKLGNRNQGAETRDSKTGMRNQGLETRDSKPVETRDRKLCMEPKNGGPVFFPACSGRIIDLHNYLSSGH